LTTRQSFMSVSKQLTNKLTNARLDIKQNSITQNPGYH